MRVKKLPYAHLSALSVFQPTQRSGYLVFKPFTLRFFTIKYIAPTNELKCGDYPKIISSISRQHIFLINLTTNVQEVNGHFLIYKRIDVTI